MTAQLAHRGPDDEGHWCSTDGRVALGHRRLSIIDLAGGHQPMSTEDGAIWISYNGEIYNFRELRSVLEGRGVRFRTSSDTEVILELYREFGTNAFERLNGIFALAIYDQRSKELILARDHYGVKPLYYHTSDTQVIFASEISSIIAAGVPARIDPTALHSFLTFRYCPSPLTMLEGVKKLRPGHLLRVPERGDPFEQPFWLPRTATVRIGKNEAVEEYRRLLTVAVRRQLVSDVPVGLLLSGGIDSAVIGRIMADHGGNDFSTFTIGFGGRGDYNELADARATARWLGSRHHERELTRQDYFAVFAKCFRHVEEPVAEPTIPALYQLADLASDHVKVVLAGQGADEPLAGYDRYLGAQYLPMVGSLLRHGLTQKLVSALPRNERVKRAAYAAAATDELDRFVRIHTIFPQELIGRLLKPEVREAVHVSERDLLGYWYDQAVGLEGSLDRLLFVDARTSLADDLLLFGDKMTMAHSLEMRVPFLDLELMDFLETLPSSLKLRRGVGKYLHKQALRGWIPEAILRRPKRGFATPIDQWLQHDLAAGAKRVLTRSDSACAKHFDTAVIREMIDRHSSRRDNFRRHLFALLAFEIWHTEFVDRDEFDLNLLLGDGASAVSSV